MTKEEAKQYALRVLKESGVADDAATQIASAFDNDKFFNGFVPRPEVDRALSLEQQKYDQFKTRNEYLEKEWLPQAKQAYEKNVAGIKTLEKYQELYGPIDQSDPAALRRAAAATGITKEEVAETLKQELASRDRATLDLMDIREEHLDRFKKRLPIKEFEKHVESLQRSGEYVGIRAAYKDWIEPQVEAQTPHRFSEADLAARDKRIREEAEKDFASRHKVPLDTRQREPHLLLDAARLKKENTSNDTKSGRDAFLEVMSDPDPDTVRQRFPV